MFSSVKVTLPEGQTKAPVNVLKQICKSYWLDNCQHYGHSFRNSHSQNQASKGLQAEIKKKEIVKWLDVSVIYSITDSNWASLVQYMPKKVVIIVVSNEKDQLVST